MGSANVACSHVLIYKEQVTTTFWFQGYILMNILSDQPRNECGKNNGQSYYQALCQECSEAQKFNYMYKNIITHKHFKSCLSGPMPEKPVD